MYCDGAVSIYITRALDRSAKSTTVRPSLLCAIADIRMPDLVAPASVPNRSAHKTAPSAPVESHQDAIAAAASIIALVYSLLSSCCVRRGGNQEDPQIPHLPGELPPPSPPNLPPATT